MRCAVHDPAPFGAEQTWPFANGHRHLPKVVMAAVPFAAQRHTVTQNLYQQGAVAEVKERLSRLQPDAAPLWGRMNVAQMLAHCVMSFEMALGEFNPPRKRLGYLFGRLAKRSLIDRGEPMRRNAPTARRMVVTDTREFEQERNRLARLIDRFVSAGPAKCTTHPHLFLGPLTPTEWATLMYQHLDHHLRQFQS